MSLEDKISQLTLAIDQLNTTINRLNVVRASYLIDDDIIPLAKWSEIHKWPTVGALRNIVYNKHSNSAKLFIVKLGRRVYIDQKKFFEWAKSNPDFSFKPKQK